MNAVLEKLNKIGIVPVVVINNVEDAAPLAKALCAGGLPCAEVTFRTAAAREAIKIMTETCPEMVVGAGTVLNAEQVDAAVEAGYKVLIIDSMTHEWKWLNDVHDKMPGNSFTNWGKLKPRHHKFMDKVLNSPIHIIATARGKDDWVLEDKNGKQVPKKVGMGQQQDKDISYEYTVSLMIAQDTHVASADKDNTKLFDGRFEVLTEKDGVRLYEWANKGEAPAPKKDTPKYTETTYDSEDMLKSVKKEIISVCTELGGTKNADLMAVLKTYVASGNPNAIQSLEEAKKCLTEIKAIKPIEA